MKVRLLQATLAILLATAVASAQRVPHRVFVSVTDRSGAPITDLTARDFELTENGVKREISRTALGPPMRIILLVDSSTTIAPMLVSVRRGLTAFLEVIPASQEMALITTGGQIGIRVAPHRIDRSWRAPSRHSRHRAVPTPSWIRCSRPTAGS